MGRTFMILKVKPGIEFRDYRYASMRELNFCGLKVDINHYDIVYKSTYKGSCTNTDEILEDIFAIFNINHPEDYKASSLSVSDIVYLGAEYYFCDSVGWVKLDTNRKVV